MLRLRDLNGEQRKTLAVIKSESRRLPKAARAKLVKAAIETGLVEANLGNPDHGDGTSVGWRQETASSYPGVNRRDRRASVRRFFDEALQRLHPGETAGQLAAAVQRPAARYAGRYEGASEQARTLMNQLSGVRGAPAGTSARGESAAVAPTGTPGDPRQLLPEVLAMLSGHASPVDVALASTQLQAPPSAGSRAAPTQGGQREGAAPKSGPARTLHAGGGWGGSEKLVTGLRGLAGSEGLRLGSTKRSPGENASVGGASGSDHLTTNKFAYAGDFANGRGEDDAKLRFAKQAAAHYGVKFVKDSYESGGTITVHGVKYRVQILYGAGVDHADHVHVGVHRL